MLGLIYERDNNILLIEKHVYFLWTWPIYCSIKSSYVYVYSNFKETYLNSTFTVYFSLSLNTLEISTF